MKWIKKEPVAFWGMLTVLINACIAAGITFGYIDWTAGEIAAALGIVAALGAIFIAVARSQTTALAAPKGRMLYPLVPDPREFLLDELEPHDET